MRQTACRREEYEVTRVQGVRGHDHGERLSAGWRFVRAVLYRPVIYSVRRTYLHIERIPRQGPVILVTNHVSHYDPLLLSAFVLDAGRTPHFLAKESIFSVPVVGSAMRAMGHIPVKRGTADARQSLSAAVDALHAGNCIVLHPEGTVTRDPDGWPMSGKTGAARLATLVPDVAVIPVAQWGVQEQIDLYRKKIKLIPRPHHVISVGEPIDLTAFRGREPDAHLLHEITDAIMRRLRHDVAVLRGEPDPGGELYEWNRPGHAA